jgi:hypothetical protein
MAAFDVTCWFAGNLVIGPVCRNCVPNNAVTVARNWITLCYKGLLRNDCWIMICRLFPVKLVSYIEFTFLYDTGRFIIYSGITKIYDRKTIGQVFTKPVQIEAVPLQA